MINLIFKKEDCCEFYYRNISFNIYNNFILFVVEKNDNGATVSLVSSFLLSWVLIGIVSIPIKFKEFGKRFTISRNIITLISIIIISLIMGIIL